MTILLVEDHADTRRALRTLLELGGHSVIEAHDMNSALAAATDSFDLLLSDIGLPDGDGWSLLQMMSKKRSVNAIAISGFSFPEDLARSKEAGFLVHLAKPFTAEEFSAALTKVTTHGDKQKLSTKKRNIRRTISDLR